MKAVISPFDAGYRAGRLDAMLGLNLTYSRAGDTRYCAEYARGYCLGQAAAGA